MAKRIFKTTKVLSGTRTEFRKWSDWDEGDVIICTLKGTQANRKNKSKKDWIVFVEEAFLSDKKEEKRLVGKDLLLNCAGQLDKGLAQVEMGDTVQVTYNGSQEMEGGEFAGQMAHLMEVVQVEEEGAEALEEEVEEDEDGL